MFGASVFLFGLAALAVPVLLHRLRTHAGTQRVFSSLMLMRNHEAPMQSEQRLHRLFLLLLRLLLLLALILAFAQPFVDRGAPAASANSVAHLVVLDTSLSMGRAGVFDAAKSASAEIIRDSEGPVALATISDEAEMRHPPGAAKAGLTAALGRVESSQTALRFEGVLERIDGLAGAMSAPGSRLEVHLVSDFQASGMPVRFNALLADTTWSLHLHRVGVEQPNWAITRFEKAAGGDLMVQVEGFDTPAATVTVVLENGRVREERVLTLADASAGLSAAGRLNVPVDRAVGRWTATLVKDDALAADNVSYLALRAPEADRIQVWGESEPGARYFGTAARAVRDDVNLEFAGVGDQLADDAALVVLSDPGQLAPALENRLKRFLQTGGSILMAVGNATRTLGRLPLVDVPIKSTRLVTRRNGVVAADPSHPVMRDLGEWLDITVFQRVSPVSSVAAHVLAETDDGAPLLVEYNIGGGRLLVLLTAFDPAWSSLVVQPAFVTLVSNGIKYLTHRGLPSMAVAGQTITLPTGAAQIISPTGERVLGLSETMTRPSLSLDRAGFYDLRTPGGSRTLVVRLPVAESDFTPAPATLLEQWQKAQDVTESLPSDAGQSQGDGERVEFAAWLLALLVVLALAEPLVANAAPQAVKRQPASLPASATP